MGDCVKLNLTASKWSFWSFGNDEGWAGLRPVLVFTSSTALSGFLARIFSIAIKQCGLARPSQVWPDFLTVLPLSIRQ